MNDYLDKLKSIDLRPKKVKVEEQKEKILLEQDKGMTDMHAEIIGWITENPKASIEQAQAFAKQLGIELTELEHHIFMILADILTEGRSKGFTGTYDPEQIKMGIEVEYEHTTIPQIAEKISKDHLAELPDYYTRLAKMESDAGFER